MRKILPKYYEENRLLRKEFSVNIEKFETTEVNVECFECEGEGSINYPGAGCTKAPYSECCGGCDSFAPCEECKGSANITFEIYPREIVDHLPAYDLLYFENKKYIPQYVGSLSFYREGKEEMIDLYYVESISTKKRVQYVTFVKEDEEDLIEDIKLERLLSVDNPDAFQKSNEFYYFARQLAVLYDLVKIEFYETS